MIQTDSDKKKTYLLPFAMSHISYILFFFYHIPYSLKFSRLKHFAVFAGYRYTTKILSAKNLVLVVYVRMHFTGLTLDHEHFIRENLFLSRI